MALTRYTRRGVVVTYDALSCTARVLGPRMADPALATIVLPPLVGKFTSSPLTDKVRAHNRELHVSCRV